MFSTIPFGPRTNGVASYSLGKPTASFPASVATDQKLAIGVDRLQVTLSAPLDTVTTAITVSDASKIVPWMLLSIDNEIVQVTAAPTGNQVPISRGFDGTTPALHLTSALVSGFIDAWHHNTLVSEIEAIENALGANLSKVPGVAFVMTSPFQFVPQSPGGSLIAGANSITLTPVPAGISGSDVGHYVYISGGTGSAEAALILGGTAVGGNPSGTLIIQCANTHSGAWTIQTATGGIQEAICSLPAAGGEVYVNASVTLFANVGPCGKNSVVVRKMGGCTALGSFTIFGQSSVGDGRTETFSYVTPTPTLATSGVVVKGNNATWDYTKPTYSAFEANLNSYPVTSLCPIQFVANGVLGAVNVPSSALANSGGAGVLGLCTTSSTNSVSVGVGAYANMLVAGCSAWGGNFAVSNQTSPIGTTGVHAASILGLELDVNVFGPGNSDGVTGLQIIGGSSNIQPLAANAIQIAPLGSLSPPSLGQPKWTAGVQCYVGACKVAIDVQQVDTGNNSASQPIKFSSTDAAGTVRNGNIQQEADGTLLLTGGGNAAPFKGVAAQDGAGNPLILLQPGITYLNPLPVYASNAAATAGGLSVGTLYKTSTGQVMQVY